MQNAVLLFTLWLNSANAITTVRNKRNNMYRPSFVYSLYILVNAISRDRVNEEKRNFARKVQFGPRVSRYIYVYIRTNDGPGLEDSDEME